MAAAVPTDFPVDDILRRAVTRDWPIRFPDAVPWDVAKQIGQEGRADWRRNMRLRSRCLRHWQNTAVAAVWGHSKAEILKIICGLRGKRVGGRQLPEEVLAHILVFAVEPTGRIIREPKNCVSRIGVEGVLPFAMMRLVTAHILGLPHAALRTRRALSAERNMLNKMLRRIQRVRRKARRAVNKVSNLLESFVFANMPYVAMAEGFDSMKLHMFFRR